MKKISINKLLKCIGILCGTAMLLGLNSCSSEKDPEAVVNLLPVQKKRSGDGIWSMADNKGNIVYDNAFDGKPTLAVNGFFSVRMNNRYSTLYKIGENGPEVVNGCGHLEDVGKMQDGLIPVVRRGGRIEVVNESGETQFDLSPVDGVEIKECDKSFSSGMLLVKTKERKYGFVDKKGNNVVPCIYEYASRFSNGYAIVSKKGSGYSEWSLIDTSGDEVIDLGESIYGFDMLCGYIKGVKDGKYVLMDTDGDEYKLPEGTCNLLDMHDGLIIYNAGRDGLTNLDGDVLIEPSYYSLQFAPNGDLIGKKVYGSSEIDILDTKGNVKQTLDFKEIEVIPGFGCLVKNKNSCAILDENFKEAGEEELRNYSIVEPYSMIRSDYKGY